MIIAILEDRKGFRKSIDFARFQEKILIQVPKNPIAYSIAHDPSPEEFPAITTIEFYFQKWLEENKVAFYREE